MYDGVIRTLTNIRHVPNFKTSLVLCTVTDQIGFQSFVVTKPVNPHSLQILDLLRNAHPNYYSSMNEPEHVLRENTIKFLLYCTQSKMLHHSNYKH